MNYRLMGKTGLRVSEIGFGGWAIGGNAHGNSYGWTDDEQSVAAIKRAIELGGNFFESADIYGAGHSEELLGLAFSELGLNSSEEIVVASQVGGRMDAAGTLRLDFSPDYVRYAADQSLRRLARVWIDLYQLHNPPLAQIREGSIFAVMDELKRQGKVRNWGVSVASVEQGLAAIEAGAATVQISYNVLTRPPERRLFGAAQQSGVGLIVGEALANGLISGKYDLNSTWVSGDIRASLPRSYITECVQVAEQLRFLEAEDKRTLPQAMIRYALDQPAVSSVIVGIKTPAQAEEDFAASAVPPISEHERRLLEGVLYGE